MIIAYPASLLRNVRVNEFFEEEYKKTSTVFDTIFIDQNTFRITKNKHLVDDQNTFRITKNKHLVDGEKVLYRGWIVTIEQYYSINEEVQRHGGNLVVSPEEYGFTQFNRDGFGYNGWTDVFGDFTPKTIRVDYDHDFDLDDVSSQLDFPLIVKGSSKSVKDDWENSMFIKDKSDFSRVLENYKDYVSQNEDDMIMLREFENFVPDEEYRLWFYQGELRRAEIHPLFNGEYDELIIDQASDIIATVKSFAMKNNIQLMTVDIVKDTQGHVRIIECGSGMVSGIRHGFVDIVSS